MLRCNDNMKRNSALYLSSLWKGFSQSWIKTMEVERTLCTEKFIKSVRPIRSLGTLMCTFVALLFLSQTTAAVDVTDYSAPQKLQITSDCHSLLCSPGCLTLPIVALNYSVLCLLRKFCNFLFCFIYFHFLSDTTDFSIPFILAFFN